MRGRGAPRRFMRRNFRGGRGGRRPRSQDDQGQMEQTGEEGQQRGGRPRYRRRAPIRPRDDNSQLESNTKVIF